MEPFAQAIVPLFNVEPIAQAIDSASLLANLAVVPPPIRAGAIVLAIVLAPLGLWLLWGGRDFDPPPLDDQGDNPPPPRTPLHAWRKSLSRPSLTAVGLSLLIVAYHAIAYTNPNLPLLQVPIERWWALALGVLIAVWGSLAIDRLQK